MTGPGQRIRVDINVLLSGQTKEVVTNESCEQ